MSKRKMRLLGWILSCVFTISLFCSGFTSADMVNEEKPVIKDELILPDIVDATEAKENNYISRVKEAEKDLYTFVFANSDGTNTMRVYSHPVKYVADDGSVRDISLDIKAKKSGGYVTADHEITTTFESKLTEGISLAYNDVELTLVPTLDLGTVPTAKLSSDGKAVAYQADDDTSFVYQLTYAGFKEDIVVEEYTGQTEYKFTLFTNGLMFCEEYGSYFLADAADNVKATIGDIIVFTADERNNTRGSLSYEVVRANQEYRLTIHLDSAYLADENTVYPIRIDPTIEVNYESSDAGAIEDVSIIQNATVSTTSGSLLVGRFPTTSLARTLMRFPNLSLGEIEPEQITAATVELRDLMCQDDEDITVECCIYNMSAPAWSESGTITWSSVGTNYLGSVLDSHLISYGQGNVSDHRYSFNIVTAAKAWAEGTQSPAKGLVFKANSDFENQSGTNVDVWRKTFASYNRNNYKPSLSITYEAFSPPKVVEIACFGREGYWDVPNGETASYVECNEPSERIRSVWFIDDQNNGYFTIRNYATGNYVMNVDSSVVHRPGSTPVTDSMQWKITLQIDGTFKIASKVDESYYLTENDASHSTSDPDIILSSANCGIRQKFRISSKVYSISVNNYFDYSFQMRMDNSLTITTETVAMINERQNKVNEYLYSEYGIDVINNAPTRMVSYADMCHGVDNITATTIEQECTHGDCDGLVELCEHVLNDSGACTAACSSPYHHNSSAKILSWFKHQLSTSSANINILWTGHRNCADGIPPVADPFSDVKYIVATLYNRNSVWWWDYAAFHEMGHALGADGDKNCGNIHCLMSSKFAHFGYIDFAGDLFCDQCDQLIRAKTHQRFY